MNSKNCVWALLICLYIVQAYKLHGLCSLLHGNLLTYLSACMYISLDYSIGQNLLHIAFMDGVARTLYNSSADETQL